jgi:AcrR family transcriptional regulator
VASTPGRSGPAKPSCEPWGEGGPPHSLEPAGVEQRRRILAATAELVAERGYGVVTVDLIAAAAEVGKATFYRHFEDKEECYLALFDQTAGEIVRQARDVYVATAGEWPERLAAVLDVALRLAEAEPQPVRACLGEALGAGPVATERYERLRERFAGLLRPGRALNPRGAELPETLEVTLAGGVLWMIDRHLANEGPETLRLLFPEALRFLLAPYLGDERARLVAHDPGSAGF